MKIVSILALIVMIIGGVITYLSKKIYPVVFKGENRDESSDNLKVKLIGFIIALIGAWALFILKK